MSTQSSLEATPRTAAGKGEAQRLRKTGKIPAIAYGKGLAATTLAVSPKEIVSILKSEHGKNSVIEMKIGGKPTTVMIKDYTYHPVSRELLHVDFVEVKADQDVNVEIPLFTTGKAAGLVTGGVLRQVFRFVPVRCKPGVIPAKIEVDVTKLEMGDHIATKDLPLPAGVTVLLPAEQTVVAVVAPEKERTEEEAVPGAAAAAAPGAPAAAGAAAPAAAGAAGAAKAPAKKEEKKK
jgi:large subunit ribosomal protein L25